MEQTQFTAYMQQTVEGVMERLRSFYCREDVERKLRELVAQQRAGKSGYRFRLRELEEMCRACGVDAKRLCDSSTRESELSRIPTRSELRVKLMEELYDIYLRFPTSEMFMERLVRRLLDGDFAEDSLRMAILKKFLRDTDYHCKSVFALAEKRLRGEDAAVYASLKGEEKKSFLISKLDEGIFDFLKSEADPLSLLRFLMKHVRADEAGKFELSAATAAAMGGGKDAVACLETLERTLAAGEANNAAALIDAAEKEFCAYLKQFTYTKKKAKDASKAAGTKDEVYRQAKKDFLKPMKKAGTLLKLADDLACGKFRVNGATKEQLYAFALAFGMSADGDSLRDIEKNLFHDYYNDNLLRYVLDSEYIENNTNYETEPSGEGINYKNYVEIIYLYYLSKFPAMAAGEKLEKAQQLIERCAKMAKEAPDRVENAPDERTVMFREDYFRRALDIEDEDRLAEFICSHYYIYNPRYSSSRISYASERNTARGLYRALAETMVSEYPESFGSMYDNMELPAGADVADMLECLRNAGREDIAGDGRFAALLEKLGDKLKLKKRKILALAAGDETALPDCSRTEMIALYCCYFRLVLEELTEDFGVMDLPSLYGEFCDGDGIRPGINHYLSESRYQCISPKNAFDMFVVFTLFLELISWGE